MHIQPKNARQLKAYMLLWDYQNKGFKYYQIKTNGDNCEECNNLEGKKLLISEGQIGINLPPFHPNCDCTTQIIDNNGNIVFSITDEVKENDTSSELSYLQTSIKQIVLGNYSDDATLLGTIGQIALGFIGFDLPADIRDLMYDITNFKLTLSHALQTLLDAASLLPVIGSLKYSDEVIDAAKKTDNFKKSNSNATKIKFYSKTKSHNKLKNQIKARGWSIESITETVNNPFQTRESINKSTGNLATVFYNEDGSYVIIDNITDEIVQISDRFDPNWKPDSSIINPYINKKNHKE